MALSFTAVRFRQPPKLLIKEIWMIRCLETPPKVAYRVTSKVRNPTMPSPLPSWQATTKCPEWTQVVIRPDLVLVSKRPTIWERRPQPRRLSRTMMWNSRNHGLNQVVMVSRKARQLGNQSLAANLRPLITLAHQLPFTRDKRLRRSASRGLTISVSKETCHRSSKG